jgi:hypothetical protein
VNEVKVAKAGKRTATDQVLICAVADTKRVKIGFLSVTAVLFH